MIITLTSDFGTKDNSVAIAKGLILKHLPQANIVDISHHVLPFNLNHCFYMLQSAYRNFPKDTIHISLFDILQYDDINTLLCNQLDQYLISTDNGLLPSIFEKEENVNFYEVPIKATGFYQWIEQCAQFIAKNQNNLLQNLYTTTPIKGAKIIHPVIYENVIECSVLHIDQYENIILNITEETFEKHRAGRNFQITYLREHLVGKISPYYYKVNNGDLICRFNQSGYMELSVFEGKASSLISIESYYAERLFSSKVKIEFI